MINVPFMTVCPPGPVTVTVAFPIDAPEGTKKLICEPETKKSCAARSTPLLSLILTEAPASVVGNGNVVAASVAGASELPKSVAIESGATEPPTKLDALVTTAPVGLSGVSFTIERRSFSRSQRFPSDPTAASSKLGSPLVSYRINLPSIVDLPITLLTYPVEQKNQKLPPGAEINLIGTFGPVEMDDEPGDSLKRINPLKIGTPVR